MKISYKWLKEYVDTTKTPQELDDLLTFSGLEVEDVENVETIKGGLEHVVIAQVMTCEPHPNSDHLHITTVDVGGDRLLDIVCGAPNVAAGQKVVCATIGTQIWTSETEHFEIKKSKIRGAVSEGMLCAADELQLGTSHDGIMVLPDDAPVGMPARDYFHVEEDYVLDVAITANRSDATSHIGVARDVVAVLNTREHAGVSLRWPQVCTDLTPTAAGTPVRVTVERPDLAPRYSGITLRGVRVAESPEWLKNKLRTVGIRPINNIVDVTNFVLMEVGQPMHCFDADKIKQQHVVVRTCPEGTPFVTLDGVERQLSERDLMICDDEVPMCIAGVFGGQQSGVTMETRNVFLESAYFNPVSIRKTAKRHTLKTDASFRYERGCDPNITVWALRRAVYLIKQLAGGEVCGDLVDVYPTPIQRAEVDINFKRVFDLIGSPIPMEALRTALTSLDIEIVASDSEGMHLRIPTCKVDVYRECDVVEEIMRIYGYNNINFDEHLSSSLSYSTKPNVRQVQNIVSDYLTNNGFSEIMNNSLTKSSYYDDNPDFDPRRSVTILNPLSKELNVMRQTLLYSGLECITYNLNHQIHDQKLYEFGRAYFHNAEAPADGDVALRYPEEQHLSILTTGNEVPENWKIKSEPTDVFFLKGHVYNIMRRLRLPLNRMQLVEAREHYYAEGVDIILKDNHRQVASFGVLSKETLRRADCKQAVYYADFNWDVVLDTLPRKELVYTEVVRYPEVRRDLAMVLNGDVRFADIARVAHDTEKKLLKRISLFDVYEGRGIAQGKKSYAVSFILQDQNKTLTDKQIEQVMAKLQHNFEVQLGAVIRSE